MKKKKKKNGWAVHFKQRLASITIIGTILSLLVADVLSAFLTACPTAYASNPRTWTLVWSDEFNGPMGSPVNSSKWSFDLGGNGWGNNELETYTSRTANSHLEGGRLVIKALKEN